VGELDGEWVVERVAGALPPMVGVEKRIRGTSGETRVGALARVRFDVRGRELHYRFPFQGVVDSLEPDNGGFAGRTIVAGREVGRFRMRRREAEAAEALRDQLTKHLDEALAMEANVVRMLDSLIRTTEDEGSATLFRAHREQTERQEERLRRRLEAYGASPSIVREAGGMLGVLMKGVLDVARGERAGRNARDAYATEHMEIAAYELLERIATRAGDAETARVARENRDEEREMARRLEEHWDRFAELSLGEAGATPSTPAA
jgi:ferritin-like metal-binding protein YciE